jgi:hypothetical protein
MTQPEQTQPSPAPETQVSGAVRISEVDCGSIVFPTCRDISMAGFRMLTSSEIYDAMGVPAALRRQEPRFDEDLSTPLDPAQAVQVLDLFVSIPGPQQNPSCGCAAPHPDGVSHMTGPGYDLLSGISATNHWDLDRDERNS